MSCIVCLSLFGSTDLVSFVRLSFISFCSLDMQYNLEGEDLFFECSQFDTAMVNQGCTRSKREINSIVCDN